MRLKLTRSLKSGAQPLFEDDAHVENVEISWVRNFNMVEAEALLYYVCRDGYALPINMNERRQSRFCQWCGSTLTKNLIGKRTLLACSRRPQCEFIHWNNPTPFVNILVTRNDAVLLVRREHEPASGDWCLPGGYMDSFETPEETAKRELFEETGLKAIIDRQNLITVSTQGYNDIQIFFGATIIFGQLTACGQETSAVRFFTEKELPGNIAFVDHHQLIRSWFANKLIRQTEFSQLTQSFSPDQSPRSVM